MNVITKKDVELTSWGTDLFLTAVNRTSNRFVLGASYVIDNPCPELIQKILNKHQQYLDYLEKFKETQGKLGNSKGIPMEELAFIKEFWNVV